MITEICKSRGRHGHKPESYEEKYERRQEKRENLRKKNRTVCRLAHKYHGKKDKEIFRSAREQEFLRRRHLVTETPKRKDIQQLPSREESWNNCNLQLHTKSVQRDFSDSFVTVNLNSSSKSTFAVKVSQSCKGTQTSDESSVAKKNSGQQTDCGTAVLDKEIIELSNYLKEALHRELLLKQKMMILQELLTTLLQAAEKSWKGQLNEDKLKSRLVALENQLQTCTQSYSKRSLKKILLEMEDQKQNYEQKMKETLQKVLEEKLQAEKQLQNTQKTLAVSEKDCTLLKEQYGILKKDWSQLIDKHVELENKFNVLENKLEWSDTQNLQLHQALQNMETERAALYSSIDKLQENNRQTMECLSAMEEKLWTEERQKLALEATINQLHRQNSPEKSKILTTDRATLHAQSETGEKRRENKLKDELQVRTFQLTDKKKERQHHHWIPLLMVVTAAALVSYLINLIP